MAAIQDRSDHHPESTGSSVEKVGDGDASDGTWHQKQVKLPRIVFLRPSAEYAAAVQRDAESIVYSEAEERAVKRKLDTVILPLVLCCTLFNQLDRTNIGNAHVLAGFNDTFDTIDNKKWTLALGIFYLSYSLVQIPANVIQRYVGANRLFCAVLIAWGLGSFSLVYAKGFPSLMVLRVLLGLGEGGYSSIFYFMTFFYTRSELAKRFGICIASGLSRSIGGLLAFGLVRVQTSLFAGWQFLFLMESIPPIALGFLVLLFLPSFPFSAWFLTPRERAIASARLQRDQKPQSRGGLTWWQALRAILSDPNAWLFLVTFVTFNVGNNTMTYFLPTVIHDLGFNAITAQGLTSAPYAFAYGFNFLQTWHSDHTRQRGLHLMLSAFLAVIGYVILAIQRNVASSYFATFLIVTANTNLAPLCISWAANTFSPTPKRGVGIAFILASSFLSVATPQVYFDPEDKFRKGHTIAAGCTAVSFITIAILRTRLSMLNKRNAMARAALPIEETKKSCEVAEISDSDSRYVFVL